MTDFYDDIEIKEEAFPILGSEKLIELSAKEIRDVFFRKDVFYADVTLYVRIKRDRMHDIYVFKIIQPFECHFYIVANNLFGHQWESLELLGDYSDVKEDAFEFIKKYLHKYVSKKKGDIKVEADLDTFNEAIRFNPGCEVPPEMQEIEDDTEI